MGVTTSVMSDGKTTRIEISGRFDFALHREFRDTYRNIDQEGHIFRVNMKMADYMDSSALGMLLLLNEHVHNIKGSVILEAASPNIRHILEVASFDRLFKMEA